MTENSWRRQHHVLVTDAHAMGSIGAIRSLGRAGYRVVAASARKDALGLRSSFSYRALVCPSYDANPAEFVDWLGRTVEEEAISAIVPSEGVLLTIRADYDRFRRLLPVSDPRIVYAGMSKCDLFEQFDKTPLGVGLPPFLLLREGEPVPSPQALAGLGLPLFVKADASYARSGLDSLVRRCENVDEACSLFPELLRRYHRILVQGYAAGVGVGAFLLRWNGRILGRFMHRRLHEVPHTGGASSYREAWANEAILDDATRRMEALRWEGVGMFEYRWDPVTGRFHLLEFNGRFWGSLHLALYAGVDFPRLLLDAFHGHEASCGSYDLKARSRWTFPREVEYVLSCVRDGSLPLSKRCWPILEFFLLGLDPRVRSDLLFPGDRMLYLRAMRQTFMKFLQ